MRANYNARMSPLCLFLVCVASGIVAAADMSQDGRNDILTYSELIELLLCALSEIFSAHFMQPRLISSA